MRAYFFTTFYLMFFVLWCLACVSGMDARDDYRDRQIIAAWRGVSVEQVGSVDPDQVREARAELYGIDN